MALVKGCGGRLHSPSVIAEASEFFAELWMGRITRYVGVTTSGDDDDVVTLDVRHGGHASDNAAYRLVGEAMSLTAAGVYWDSRSRKKEELPAHVRIPLRHRYKHRRTVGHTLDSTPAQRL